MEIRLDGQVALVTGASRGIGREIAATFAAAGASVLLSSRREDRLIDAAASMTGEVAWRVANAGDPEQAESCVGYCVERFGTIDILVTNAATCPYAGPLVDMDMALARKTTDVNELGHLAWVQAAIRAGLGGARRGSVLTIASVGGLTVHKNLGWYNVTKAAGIHLTKHLAAELAPNVRVNAIAPGLIRTDFSRAQLKESGEAAAQAIPMGRIGEAADVAAAALFLTSDAASWITGHTLVVDGGMLLES